jgi:hypothetical protein
MSDETDIPTQSDQPPDIRRQLLLAQMEECWADIRNFDSILWQIPAAISAIGGLMVNALAQKEINFGPWSRPTIAYAAALLTLPLLAALVKNRIFQTDRNNWRISLYRAYVSGGPLEIQDYYPENASLGKVAKDLVLLSSREIHHRFRRGPWYWRISAGALRGVSAFNVLLLVSLGVFAGELAIGTWLTLHILIPDRVPIP